MLLLQLQKQNYRTEKKRVAAELLATLQDPTVVVMADWLKVRGTLRQWTRLFCVLKPGLLLLYKNPKTDKVSVLRTNWMCSDLRLYRLAYDLFEYRLLYRYNAK